jgi:molybdopterin-guanine dinucleotide biosynthesis protein B
LIERVSPCDLLLVEGFKREAIPKMEVFRRENAKEALHPSDPHIVAIAADCRFETALPQYDLNDAPGIAEFVCRFNSLA